MKIAVGRGTFQSGIRDETSPYRPTYEVCDLRAGLEREWAFDAMVVTYTADGFTFQPRVTKVGIDYAEKRYGMKLFTSVLMADIDNPGHGEWTRELREAFDSRWIGLGAAGGVLETVGAYLTPHGFRLVQPMARRVATRNVERWIDAWYCELSAAGIAVDGNARDWTRHMRAPHVRRGGGSYVRRADWIDLGRMKPREIAPRVWSAGGLTPEKKARPPVVRAEREANGWAPLSDWVKEGAIVGKAIRDHGVNGETHHKVYMAIAGAMLQVAMKPSRIVECVRSVAIGAAAKHSDTHVKSARDTLGRAEAGLPYVGGEWLIRHVPFIADAMARACGSEVELPPSPEESGEKMRAIIRGAGHGLIVMNGECGLGKTAAAIDVACERAGRGEKTAISVNSNALAKQIEKDVRAKGVGVRRVFGPLSVEGPEECVYRKRALPMVKGGQNLRRMFCQPGGRKCERWDTCLVRDGVVGDDGSKVVVGTHWLMGSLSEEAGVNGLMIVDEPPSALDDVAITKIELGVMKSRRESFAAGYVDSMITVVDALEETGEGFSRELPREIRAAGPWAEDMTGWETPPLRQGAKEMARAMGAPEIGKASEVLKNVWRAIRSEQKVLWRVDRGGPSTPHGGGISFVLEHKKLRDVLNRAGGCVVMDANADSNIAIYRKLVGDEALGVVGFRAADGCTVERTQTLLGKTTRTAWIRGGSLVSEPVERALSTFADWVRENDSGGVYGLISYAPVEAAVRLGLGERVEWQSKWGDAEQLGGMAERAIGWMRGRLVTLHYGATRGFNHMAGAEGLATLGDPWANLTSVADDLNYWALPTWEYDSRQILICKAELEQAHGRLRVVHRPPTGRPIRAMHLGAVRPGGWGWSFGSIREVDAAKRLEPVQIAREIRAM